MLCLACGAEMRLVQVVKDATMLVSGYEHHTWQCSGCSTVEQRMTFTRGSTPTPPVPKEPIQTVLAEPTQTGPVKLTQTGPVELTQTVSVEASQAVPVEPAHPKPPAAMPLTKAWAKALEKLRKFEDRATAAKEASRETERRAQFKREWDSFRSVSPPSASTLP